MAVWANRDERQAVAAAEYEHIMTTPGPPPMGAYIDAWVIGFVFGEMWRRGVLAPRDRRWITLSCVAAAGAAYPIETHVWAALNSGDVTFEEFDEFVLHCATQLGWPKASVLQMYGLQAMAKLAEQRGEPLGELQFEPWTDPVDDDARRTRGETSYREVHGAEPPAGRTAFRGAAYLDYLYGEIWTRRRYLTRRDRRIVSICCCGAAGVDEEAREHLRAALVQGDMSSDDLQELVVHFAVYVGWALGRRLDDLLVDVASELGAA